MQQLINRNQKQTISSLEISELTGKRHDHVMRDIRNMLSALALDIPSFGEIYFDALNREQKCFNLPKRESLILASGYDIHLRAKIIDKWSELESGVFQLPQTFSQALRALADVTEEKELGLDIADYLIRFKQNN